MQKISPVASTHRLNSPPILLSRSPLGLNYLALRNVHASLLVQAIGMRLSGPPSRLLWTNLPTRSGPVQPHVSPQRIYLDGFFSAINPVSTRTPSFHCLSANLADRTIHR